MSGWMQVMSNDGSGEFRMSEGVQERVMAAVSAFGSQQALRCLALAYKKHSTNSSKVTSNPSHTPGATLDKRSPPLPTSPPPP